MLILRVFTTYWDVLKKKDPFRSIFLRHRKKDPFQNEIKVLFHMLLIYVSQNHIWKANKLVHRLRESLTKHTIFKTCFCHFLMISFVIYFIQTN